MMSDSASLGPKGKKKSLGSAERKGAAGFEAFYSAVYGDRWPSLKHSLSEPVQQVARINSFADPASVEHMGAGLERIGFGGCEALKVDSSEKIDSGSGSGLTEFYFMDPASILAASALEVQSGDEVLDLCAAPGGKSLILAERVGPTGKLVCNEISDRRRARLKAVLHDYLPSSLLERIQVTGHDGSQWCLHQKEAFDRILLDAPCSGERHLLSDAQEMKTWSPARSKHLSVRQYALLASALAVVRKGGRILYSTCSISPAENDAVISRLLKKRAGEVRVLSFRSELGDSTEHGWSILPDRTGFGPIYFSLLERQP
jgi:5-methylcytosine rRNA methyltransferase NSUN4